MKIFAYDCRPFDEAGYFRKLEKELDIEIGLCDKPLGMKNVRLAEGCNCVSIMFSPVDRQILDALKDMGVGLVSTRTVGFDHIDVEYARHLGIAVSRSFYAAHSVAEYTLMLMLMSLRNAKRMMQRADINDYTLRGLCGGLLRDKTVGLIGCGCIGREVAEMLRGFGCRICIFDRRQRGMQGVEYMSIDEIYSQCDIISLHLPLSELSRNMINEKTISMMRPGVVLINTARGGLVDTGALIAALESGRVGACALDVLEGEAGIFYADRKSVVLKNRELAILKNMPNVILSPHVAFYTDSAVSEMVCNSLKSCMKFCRGESDELRIV